MECLPCNQKNLPGAKRKKPIVLGTATPVIDYVQVLIDKYAGFKKNQRIFVTGTGVQALVDDGVIARVS